MQKMNGSYYLSTSRHSGLEIPTGTPSSSPSKLRGRGSPIPTNGGLGSYESEKGWLSTSPPAELRGRVFSVFTPAMVAPSHENTLRLSMDGSSVSRQSPSYSPHHHAISTNGSLNKKRNRPFPSPDMEALKCLVRFVKHLKQN